MNQTITRPTPSPKKLAGFISISGMTSGKVGWTCPPQSHVATPLFAGAYMQVDGKFFAQPVFSLERVHWSPAGQVDSASKTVLRSGVILLE